MLPAGTALPPPPVASPLGRLRTAARPRAFLQVEIEAPSPGVYQVVVSAYNVPDGPQDFALVVTGDFVELVSCDSVDVKTQSPSDLLRTESPDSSRSPTARTEPPYAFATFNPHARAHVAVAALPSPPLTHGRGLERVRSCSTSPTPSHLPSWAMFHPNWTYAFAAATHPGMQAHDRCGSLMQRHNRRAAHDRTAPNAIAEPDAIATDGRTHAVPNAHAVHSPDEFADARASNAAAFSSTLVVPIARADVRPDHGAQRTTTPEHSADRSL